MGLLDDNRLAFTLLELELGNEDEIICEHSAFYVALCGALPCGCRGEPYAEAALVVHIGGDGEGFGVDPLYRYRARGLGAIQGGGPGGVAIEGDYVSIMHIAEGVLHILLGKYFLFYLIHLYNLFLVVLNYLQQNLKYALLKNHSNHYESHTSFE